MRSSIRMNLSKRKLQSLLNESLQGFSKDLSKALAEHCAEIADENFKTPFSFTGTMSDLDTTSVTVKEDKRGLYKVIASGPYVYELEYGSGIAGQEGEGNNAYGSFDYPEPPSGYNPQEEHYARPEGSSLYPREGPSPQHFWTFRSNDEPMTDAEPFVRYKREKYYDEGGVIAKEFVRTHTIKVPHWEDEEYVDSKGRHRTKHKKVWEKQKVEEVYWKDVNVNPGWHFETDDDEQRTTVEEEVDGLYKTRGSEPNYCLFNAYAETVDNIDDIAEEISI